MRNQLLTDMIAILLTLCSWTLASSAAVSSATPPLFPALDMDSELVMQRLQVDSQGRIPTVKQFDRDWVGSLDKRGEPIVYTRDNSANFEFLGMPVGGIGTGQLYLGGDGKLWYWDIFNAKGAGDTHHIHTHYQPYRRSDNEDAAQHVLTQGFAIRLNENGKT